MNARISMTGRPVNPLLQLLYLVAGSVLLIGAVVMGAVILVFVLALALVLGLVFWARVWWVKRRLARGGVRPVDGSMSDARRQRSGDIIEVEYTVVDERDPRDERR